MAETMSIGSEEFYYEVILGMAGIRTSCLYSLEVTLGEHVEPTDGMILGRLKSLGEKFCILNTFVADVQDQELDNNSGGLYLLAFAHDITICLDPYRKDLEKLHETVRTLDIIFSRVYPYHQLFDDLLCVIQDILTYKKKGVNILNTIDDYLRNSVGPTRVALGFISRDISKLFFSQLELWLLNGEVNDRRKEFFIAKKESSIGRDVSFEIATAQVPTFIRDCLAAKILRAGETVLLLRSRPNATVLQETEHDGIHYIDKTGIIGVKRAELRVQCANAIEPSGFIQWHLIESIVNNVEKIATAQLHFHAIKDANLMQQLHLVKDFFLMGRGELFHEFVVQAPFNSTVAKDYNLILRNCARKVLINEDILKPFSLQMAMGEEPRLHMDYTAPWPLHLLFTSEVMELYNNVFRFLLRLKGIQVKMVGAWVRDKANRSRMEGGKRRCLQQNLWFLVNNLQYYIQVDVLDSEFATLEKGITESKDFTDIKACHSKFLANLTTQCFLDLPNARAQKTNLLFHRVGTILTLCEQYCMEVEKLDGGDVSEETVQHMTDKFYKDFEYLMALLLALKDSGAHPCQQHLTQLVLRLDFNHFFSKSFVEAAAVAMNVAECSY